MWRGHHRPDQDLLPELSRNRPKPALGALNNVTQKPRSEFAGREHAGLNSDTAQPSPAQPELHNTRVVSGLTPGMNGP